MFARPSQDSNKAAPEGNDKGLAAPAITMPRGGGAIRGMGEKFAANPVTGTGSMSVPIAASPGRSGFGPQLSLSYDSGAGNGPFGFGWSLGLPTITRKTDKGIPRYFDAEESDVFILSGAEDLVPEPDEQPLRTVEVRDEHTNTTVEKSYRVKRYRPRIEGLFARIERWTRTDNGDMHWRSISKDNILSLYGKDDNSRIVGPDEKARVYSWLICETRDDKGNAVIYRYKAEDGENVDLAQAHERNRGELGDDRRKVGRYIKRILYGNRVSLLDEDGKRPPFLTTPVIDGDWMFQVVFDYGERHYEELDLDASRLEANQHRFVLAAAAEPAGTPWVLRPDPFSSYRAGFEVRSYRRCRRVLMFHSFDELGAQPYLVRSTEFDYADLDYTTVGTIEGEFAHQGSSRFASFVRRVTQSGFVRDMAQPSVALDGISYGRYLKRSLPPLEFEYSRPAIDETVREVDPESLKNLPSGLNGTGGEWVDLDGEGLSGILTKQAGSWYYKRNLSPLPPDPPHDDDGKNGTARFGPLELVARQPSLATAGGSQQFLDLAGDGQLDLVEFQGPTPGFYERTHDEGWESFAPFGSLPVLDWNSPNLKFVDLTGDGHADILVTEDEVLCWYASLAESGFAAPQRVHKALDEEKGPRLVFADGTQSIYLADMSGDGLTDLARVRNGEVCYWPNLGYGRFGAKVTMDRAPWFDHPDLFDQRRVSLADIDGSGTTDIIYLGHDGAMLYFNQSGNSWSAGRSITTFPSTNNIASVAVLDLLGTGTACLVWSSPLPADARRPMRYIDLMHNGKPHLLVAVKNNLGAETRVKYAPSTKFYLQDRREGRRWVTRLPFPVHCVERVETYDRISNNRFVSRYAYHHGYFDGIEREFRGFGMVEQWDTDEIGSVLDNESSSPAPTNLDAASFVPPVHTKTWFHTGVYLGRDRVSRYFAGLLNGKDKGEYYREPAWGDDDTKAEPFLLDDTVLSPDMTVEEEREACRALKGSMLRQEVYARDGTDKEHHPYTVTEQNFTIERLQPRAENRHGVFFAHPREALSYHYERSPDDPRVGHAMTLKVDKYGNVLRAVAIGYRRSEAAAAHIEQEQTHITFTVNRLANPTEEQEQELDWHRVGLPAETRTYEVVKPPEPTISNARIVPFGFGDMADLMSDLFPSTQAEPAEEKVLPYGEWDWRKQWDPKAEPGGLKPDGPTSSKLRLIEHVSTLYRRNNLEGPLAPGQMQSLGLPFESYKLALTPELTQKSFVDSGKLTPAALGDVLASEAKYVHSEGDANWWIPSGKVFYHADANAGNPAATAAQELVEARANFFLPRKFTDPFGHSAIVGYDVHKLLVTSTVDPVGNTVEALNDYRVLRPASVTDPNGNQTDATFDALGMVVATALIGKQGELSGDTLANLEPDLTEFERISFANIPRTRAADLLKNATTRIVYDIDRFRRCGQPPFAAALARETHVNHPLPQHGLRIQISFVYSDGFGREVQTKVKAEPGLEPLREPEIYIEEPGVDRLPGELIIDQTTGKPTLIWSDSRWVGTGRKIYNNKGKPIKQYEPFFTGTHLYEEEPEMTKTGVTPILFYDPLDRVVATLHPNHTWEKVVFDPWQQATYDVNDTVLSLDGSTDPLSDPDVSGFFSRLPDKDYSPTWYERRIDPANALEEWPDADPVSGQPLPENATIRASEKTAAEKAAVHSQTPTVAHLDTLGRTFLTVAHNRFKYSTPATAPPVEELHHTRVELDIEGNQREVIDAKGRIVMRYHYDMLGNRIHQASMEAGERWTLNDVTGKPIRAWDSRGHAFSTEYDALRRPVARYVKGTGSDSDPRTLGAKILFEKTEYGEGQKDDITLNLRTRVFRQSDGAGVVTSMGYSPDAKRNEAYDFKGNLLRGTRQLVQDHKTLPDWSGSPVLEKEVFTSSTTWDALNRPTAVTTPDKSVYRPTYSEANLLDNVEVSLRGAAAATPFVTNIDYNAKGQRTLIQYGNGAETTYEYDAQTFRLTRLRTMRTPGQNGMASQIFKSAETVQDLRYTYDPAGNITRIEDAALLTVFHDGKVEPVSDYTYDAVYRLIEASGREHIGQTTLGFDSPEGNFRDYPFVGFAHPNDLQALRNYAQRYEYGFVGNFNSMQHIANGGGWTRAYTYGEPSLIEPATKQSNRLSSTTIGQRTETYAYDAHGNMTSMPHLTVMAWDFKDQLRASSRQSVSSGTPETTYYVYDASGQRVRKVTERQNGTRKDERIYLGGFEVYRGYDGNGAAGTLERETLHVMDDKQRIALVETQTVENSSPINAPAPLQRYQLGNHLGSSSLEVAKDGELISCEEYHPYGTTAYQAMTSAAEVSLKRYRYTGKERDQETGFSFHGARYYALWLGRWSSPDPTGIADGLNLYSYSRNNPENLIDPNGQQGSYFERARQQGYVSNNLSVGTGKEGPEAVEAAVKGPPPVKVSLSIPLHDVTATPGSTDDASKELWEEMIKPQIEAGTPIGPPPDNESEELRQQYAVMSEADRNKFAEQEWAHQRAGYTSRPMPEGFDPLETRIARWALDEKQNAETLRAFDYAGGASLVKGLGVKLAFRLEGELVSRGFFSRASELGTAGEFHWGARTVGGIEGSRFALSPLGRRDQLLGALFELDQTKFSVPVLTKNATAVGTGVTSEGQTVTALATQDARIYSALNAVKRPDEILLDMVGRSPHPDIRVAEYLNSVGASQGELAASPLICFGCQSTIGRIAPGFKLLNPKF